MLSAYSDASFGRVSSRNLVTNFRGCVLIILSRPSLKFCKNLKFQYQCSKLIQRRIYNPGNKALTSPPGNQLLVRLGRVGKTGEHQQIYTSLLFMGWMNWSVLILYFGICEKDREYLS